MVNEYSKISKPDQEEPVRTCNLSIHSKTALVSIPALLILLVMSSLLLERNQEDLHLFDDIAPQYASLATAVVQSLQEEKALILNEMVAHDNSLQSELAVTKDTINQAMNRLARYHFNEGNGEDVVNVKRLGRFTYVMQFMGLEEMRTYGPRTDAESMKKVIDTYDTVCTNIIIMSGRQTASILHEYQRYRLALFGAVHKVSAISQAQLASSWASNTSSASPESLQALIRSKSMLSTSDILYRVYAPVKCLEATDPLESSSTISEINSAADTAARVVILPMNTNDTSALVTQCQQLTAEAYTQVAGYYPVIDDATNTRESDHEAVMICLCILIIVCVFGICVLLANLMTYKNSLHQVRAAAKEIEKLRKSLCRMQEHTDNVHIHLNTDVQQGKQKGVPAAEKVLLGSLPKIRALRKFLPDTIFAERFLGPDGQPFTQLDIRLLKDVTVLVCNVGQLNLVSPQEEVPVKQKTLETAMNIYISALDQIAEEQGGAIMDITSDYVTICWNIVEKNGKCEEHACKAALEIVEKTKAAGIKPSMGIVSDCVIAGNVGIPTLKKFVFLGKCLPLCRLMDNLARYYGLSCLIDSTTAEVVGSETNFTVRAVDILTLRPDTKDNYVTYELAGKTVSNKNEQQLQHWTQLFTHYQNGDLKSAENAIRDYTGKYGSTPLSSRFMTLIKEYPVIPHRNILDLL